MHVFQYQYPEQQIIDFDAVFLEERDDHDRRYDPPPGAQYCQSDENSAYHLTSLDIYDLLRSDPDLSNTINGSLSESRQLYRTRVKIV